MNHYQLHLKYNVLADKRRPKTEMPNKKQLPMIMQTVLNFNRKCSLRKYYLIELPLTRLPKRND